MTDPGEYARQVERYLCQKNRGHLVRVVGPAFEMVCGWATTGVPLKIALRGIDRCCERLEARGPRRRPVRIEFWYGRPDRLHDRVLYVRDGSAWRIERLYP